MVTRECFNTRVKTPDQTTMTNPIGALFGRSPIKPIEEHMKIAQGSVMKLGEIFQACLSKDWDKANEIRDLIVAAEAQSDSIKRDIRCHLPRSIFLPFARSDLLELLRIQDRMANTSKDIADLVIMRRLEIPEPIKQPFMDYFHANLETSLQAKKAINELDELLITGFRGKEVELVDNLVSQLDEMEEQCTEREFALNKLLYEHESTLPAVEVMFLYKIISKVGNIMTTSHRIGGHLLLLMAHY